MSNLIDFFKTEQKIKKLCYELYKVDWKHSHMITKEREMDSIISYYEGLLEMTKNIHMMIILKNLDMMEKYMYVMKNF